jgi:hypothetical protein
VGVVRYNVHRSTTAGFTPSAGNRIAQPTTPGYVDTVAAGTYYYRVTAEDAAGNLSTPTAELTGVSTTDLTAPTVPGSLTATGALGKVTLAWTASTDNVGVARYNVHRSTTAGFTPSAANRIAQPATPGYVDNGLAAGTYYYVVTAEDAAGNVSSGATDSAVATADTVAPTVALTAPANGSTVGGASVNVTANASDDIGVAGVQFKLDGADLMSEDTSSPYGITWNATAASNGPHTLTAVARDAAGNTTTASTVNVTVDNTVSPAPSGQVAAYGFEEASGATTLDSSAFGNNGTIANATRTNAGKNGSALSFNGTNATVAVLDSPSLDLTTGVTLEAWVSPAATMGTTWRTAVMKERAGGLTYGLYVNSSTNRPSGHIDTGSEVDTRGTAAVAANVWTHLAMTWDGGTLRMFVNGVQTSSRTIIGTLQVSTNNLTLGGNAVWGEYLNGKLDDVRVYNRALTLTEIQGDMNRPAP